jgi:hypothetical protein
MDTVIATVKAEIEKYAVPGYNLVSRLMEDSANKIFAVVTTSIEQNERYSFLDLYVRIVGEKIVIEHDANSKPLYEALLQAGIPREQIVIAYAGEAVPDNIG